MRLFNYDNLEAFSQTNTILHMSFLWGFFEAMFFFIVPDFFFMFVALFYFKRGVYCSLMSVVGTIVGGTIMYFFTRSFPNQFVGFLSSIPLISDKLVLYVQEALRANGLSAMFVAPLKGIPYKIYAVQAAFLNLNFVKFILLTIPVRLQRVLLLALACGGIGKVFKNNIKSQSKVWVVSYFVFWAIYYSFYAYNMTQKY